MAELIHHLTADLCEITFLQRRLDPGALTNSYEVDDLLDHASHPTATTEDPGQRAGRLFPFSAHHQDLRGGQHCCERISQIMGEHSGKDLVEPDGLAQLL